MNLREGICEITAGPPDQHVTLKVFVDARLRWCMLWEIPSATNRHRKGGELAHRTATSGPESAWTLAGGPNQIIQAADQFPKVGPEAVTWYHRNENALAFEETVRVQSLEPIRNTLWNPLLHRTFGGWVTGKGFHATDDRTLATAKPLGTFHLRVASPCEQTATADDWLRLARETAEKNADP